VPFAWNLFALVWESFATGIIQGPHLLNAKQAISHWHNLGNSNGRNGDPLMICIKLKRVGVLELWS